MIKSCLEFNRTIVLHSFADNIKKLFEDDTINIPKLLKLLHSIFKTVILKDKSELNPKEFLYI